MADEASVPPAKCHCGPLGLFHFVVGNIHFGIIVVAAIMYAHLFSIVSLLNVLLSHGPTKDEKRQLHPFAPPTRCADQ